MTPGVESRLNIRLSDETTTTLGRVGNPFYVLAFVEVPADDPGFIDPRIEKLARRFKLDSIAVIQISLPAKDRTFSDEQTAKDDRKGASPNNLYRFYDPRRLAWEAFGRQESGTAVLVDRRGISSLIVMVQPLDDPGRFIARVNAMQSDWERDEGTLSFDRD